MLKNSQTYYMKNIAFILSLSLLFACHLKYKGADIANISSLPAIKLLLMDSSIVVHAEKISSGKAIIMVYFRPDCPHCQQETKLLLSNIHALKDVQIYFLAGAPFGEIKKYSANYQLGQYENIVVGKDYEQSFAKLFEPNSVPYTAVYDTKKKLVKIYYGEVSMEKLLLAIHG